MACVTRAAVVKSASFSVTAIPEPCERVVGTSCSTIAPEGIRPAVTWFWTTLPAPAPALLSAKKPPTEMLPCATAYTCPFAACKGVCTSVPPCKEDASPRLETVTSMGAAAFGERRQIGGDHHGRDILQLQAAFRHGNAELLQQRRGGDCSVNAACELSPVPAKPTTKPYPTSWLPRTPCTVAMSFSRVCDSPVSLASENCA